MRRSQRLRPRFGIALRSILVASTLLSAATVEAAGSPDGPRGTLSSFAPHRVTTSIGDVLVYEAVRNFRKGGEARIYYVAPFVRFLSTDGLVPDVAVTRYSSSSRLSFTLVTLYPRMDEVLRGLRQVAPGLASSNVTELRFENLKVEHELLVPTLAIPAGHESRVTISNHEWAMHVSAAPGVPSGDLGVLADAMRHGNDAPTISAMVTQGETAFREQLITWDDITSSKSFQDFDQVAGDHVVTAGQLARFGADVAREIVIERYSEGDWSAGDGERDVEFDSVYDAVSRQLLDNVSSNYVDVSVLRDVLAPYHVDLDDEAFDPSVLTELIVDVKNTSKSEWKSKYGRDIETGLKDWNKGNWSGKVGAKVFGLFGGSASAGHEWDRGNTYDYKEKLERSGYLYDEFDKSFRVEKRGKIVEHVSVRVYENVGADIERRVSTRNSDTRVVWRRDLWLPLAVSAVAVSQGSRIPEHFSLD